ncbi:hypothetical protein NMY22_g16083 [Coprinellus aureogranulatus]|nr:hypothetical protein NMY22_g16083 [Coprinellus aureogranulatus]
MRFSTIAALVTTAILGASSVMANVDFEGDYTLATRDFDDELELVEARIRTSAQTTVTLERFLRRRAVSDNSSSSTSDMGDGERSGVACMCGFAVYGFTVYGMLVPNSTNVRRCARRSADRNAHIQGASKIARRFVPLASSPAPGDALTPNARCLVALSASASRAMRSAKRRCLVATPAHPSAGEVVDLLMGRKMEELDLDDPLDRLITLPKCRHAFTVETLDGVCGIKDCACLPNVPGTVTSPRYGRMFKAADLDILEKNVVAKMTQGLSGIQRDLDTIDNTAIGNALAESLKQVTSVSTKPMNPQTMRAITRERMSVFAKTPLSDPIHSEHFTADNLFPFSPETSRLWKVHVRPIIKLLADISKVTRVRPAHEHAWESAYTYLYNQEIDSIASNPERRPVILQIEAIWTAVSLRFALLQLVCKTVETMADFPGIFNQDERAMWAHLHHRERFASTSPSDQVSHCHTSLELEEFRFRLAMVKCSGRLKEQKEHLLLDAQQSRASASKIVADTIQEHCANLPNEGPSWTWLGESFVEPTNAIIQEWGKVEQSIRRDTFYEPVSLEEKLAIVRAMDFGYTGHWYNCPNGHTFVIGECGGAMEEARCPDCGETIGGRNHSLNPTNRRADEFEALLRNQGAQQNPWPWAM